MVRWLPAGTISPEAARARLDLGARVRCRDEAFASGDLDVNLHLPE